MTMFKLKVGDTAVVKSLEIADKNILSRLNDLGFIVNTKFKVLRCLKNNVAMVILYNGRELILSKEILLGVEIVYA